MYVASVYYNLNNNDDNESSAAPLHMCSRWVLYNEPAGSRRDMRGCAVFPELQRVDHLTCSSSLVFNGISDPKYERRLWLYV